MELKGNNATEAIFSKLSTIKFVVNTSRIAFDSNSGHRGGGLYSNENIDVRITGNSVVRNFH